MLTRFAHDESPICWGRPNAVEHALRPFWWLDTTEKVITGSRHSTRAEFMETMEIMARGIVKPVIGMRTHFTGLEDIFRAITDQTLSGRGALTYDN
jgi:D-arabinose 1-dehydrogenase-like Zn-dependent alcohol dehydrogenase